MKMRQVIVTSAFLSTLPLGIASMNPLSAQTNDIPSTTQPSNTPPGTTQPGDTPPRMGQPDDSSNKDQTVPKRVLVSCGPKNAGRIVDSNKVPPGCRVSIVNSPPAGSP